MRSRKAPQSQSKLLKSIRKCPIYAEISHLGRSAILHSEIEDPSDSPNIVFYNHYGFSIIGIGKQLCLATLCLLGTTAHQSQVLV